MWMWMCICTYMYMCMCMCACEYRQRFLYIRLHSRLKARFSLPKPRDTPPFGTPPTPATMTQSCSLKDPGIEGVATAALREEPQLPGH